MAKAPAEKRNGLPTEVIDYEQYAGAGFENATQEDYAVPFIYIVQKNSRVIDSNPDAKPGMFFNNVTGDLYEEILLIPCGFDKEYVEWVPHDDGGGYKGRHDYESGILEQCTQNDRGKWFLENGHEIVDTRKHYCLVIVPKTGEMFPAIVAMTSTQAKRSRRWMSTMNKQQIELANGKKILAPTFAFSYVCTTEQESKDSNVWYSWVIRKPEQITDETLFALAHDFYKSHLSGELNEATPEQNTE